MTMKKTEMQPIRSISASPCFHIQNKKLIPKDYPQREAPQFLHVRHPS